MVKITDVEGLKESYVEKLLSNGYSTAEQVKLEDNGLLSLELNLPMETINLINHLCNETLISKTESIKGLTSLELVNELVYALRELSFREDIPDDVRVTAIKTQQELIVYYPFHRTK